MTVMPTPEKSPCPRCDAEPGTLSVSFELVGNPLGSFSLPGMQMKVTARTRPVLRCSACPLEVVGELDADGRHVTFPPLE
jgi:hypothetical protein